MWQRMRYMYPSSLDFESSSLIFDIITTVIVTMTMAANIQLYGGSIMTSRNTAAATNTAANRVVDMPTANIVFCMYIILCLPV